MAGVNKVIVTGGAGFIPHQPSLGDLTKFYNSELKRLCLERL